MTAMDEMSKNVATLAGMMNLSPERLVGYSSLEQQVDIICSEDLYRFIRSEFTEAMEFFRFRVSKAYPFISHQKEVHGLCMGIQEEGEDSEVIAPAPKAYFDRVFVPRLESDFLTLMRKYDKLARNEAEMIADIVASYLRLQEDGYDNTRRHDRASSVVNALQPSFQRRNHSIQKVRRVRLPEEQEKRNGDYQAGEATQQERSTDMQSEPRRHDGGVVRNLLTDDKEIISGRREALRALLRDGFKDRAEDSSDFDDA